ncbi:hypothetical protein L6452_05612 [Arctium lappa]|uniref:Uncharacterized protein n=1 Tax=Arctium lappa TaxID=4217 RepID=A0ACB9EH71_ARCLA|nr:hypothetical protein L6452_05612 [Arctium lappa]
MPTQLILDEYIYTYIYIYIYNPTSFHLHTIIYHSFISHITQLNSSLLLLLQIGERRQDRVYQKRKEIYV